MKATGRKKNQLSHSEQVVIAIRKNQKTLHPVDRLSWIIAKIAVAERALETEIGYSPHFNNYVMVLGEVKDELMLIQDDVGKRC